MCTRHTAGGNFFEPGYPVGKRFLNLGYKVSHMICWDHARCPPAVM
jgi:hypothetical protein